MARQVVSRTQRRMEKKQALVLLFLVLAVSLVSFSLGVMVGRSGGNAATVPVASPARLPVAQNETEKAAVAAGGADKAPAEGGLTFYDSLPKGEVPPLGSGINLPQSQEAAGEKPAPSAKVAPPAEKESTPVIEKVPAPSAASAGPYVVQVASFRQAEDARGLRDRLAGKGYGAFTEEADLKDKGVWQRVFVGPFENAEAAGSVVERLKAEEKFSALVKKR